MLFSSRMRFSLGMRAHHLATMAYYANFEPNTIMKGIG
jgi:hypothetical protein